MPTAIVKLYGTQKTLEANGASTANGAFSQANDAGFLVADTGDYPDAEFAISLTFGTAPAAGQTVTLYAQALDIDGTNDAPVPDANFKSQRIGLFIVDNINTIQYLRLYSRNIQRNANYYIENNAGQTINAGWTLKATPVAQGTA